MTGLPESILPTLVYMGLLQIQRSVERVVDAPEVAHGTDARARGVWEIWPGLFALEEFREKCVLVERCATRGDGRSD